ncbi:uncharacterized protein LOC132202509 [Neocloeon triangulifer]|uniref:uncharacterized protein LOC132202509 n=1 Tax=Neocloeon triangulifer TaxID=2078957 RepID=UPI00286F2858|nr:uncharacterized protein LOC132202509 [Neocloeon triangulifer]
MSSTSLTISSILIFTLINFHTRELAEASDLLRCSTYQDLCFPTQDCCPGKGLTCSSANFCVCARADQQWEDFFDECRDRPAPQPTPPGNQDSSTALGIGLAVAIFAAFGILVFVCLTCNKGNEESSLRHVEIHASAPPVDNTWCGPPVLENTSQEESHSCGGQHCNSDDSPPSYDDIMGGCDDNGAAGD